MNQQLFSLRREQAIHRYVRAVDAGDLEEISAVLRQAETDAELDRLIIEINQSFAEDMGLSSEAQDAELVRLLARQHLSSAFQEDEPDAPLIVSEVAARMVSERVVPTADLETGRRLLAVHIPLPGWLSLAEVRKLAEKLRFPASDRFWKVFRETAIQMTMGRGQAQMAATRRKHAGRAHPHTSETHHEENHATD